MQTAVPTNRFHSFAMAMALELGTIPVTPRCSWTRSLHGWTVAWSTVQSRFGWMPWETSQMVNWQLKTRMVTSSVPRLQYWWPTYHYIYIYNSAWMYCLCDLWWSRYYGDLSHDWTWDDHSPIRSSFNSATQVQAATFPQFRRTKRSWWWWLWMLAWRVRRKSSYLNGLMKWSDANSNSMWWTQPIRCSVHSTLSKNRATLLRSR